MVWNEYILLPLPLIEFMSDSGNKCQRPNLAKQFSYRNGKCYYYASDYKFYNARAIAAAAVVCKAAVVLACRAVLFLIHLNLQTAALILKNMTP